jgi:hypothetical protein
MAAYRHPSVELGICPSKGQPAPRASTERFAPHLRRPLRPDGPDDNGLVSGDVELLAQFEPVAPQRPSVASSASVDGSADSAAGHPPCSRQSARRLWGNSAA